MHFIECLWCMYSFQECVDNMYSSICEWLYIERLIMMQIFQTRNAFPHRKRIMKAMLIVMSAFQILMNSNCSCQCLSMVLFMRTQILGYKRLRHKDYVCSQCSLEEVCSQCSLEKEMELPVSVSFLLDSSRRLNFLMLQ